MNEEYEKIRDQLIGRIIACKFSTRKGSDISYFLVYEKDPKIKDRFYAYDLGDRNICELDRNTKCIVSLLKYGEYTHTNELVDKLI